jgi:hypothetical protein
MLGRFLARFFRKAPEPEAPAPLPGPAGEAALLLAAYEGMGGMTTEHLVQMTQFFAGRGAARSVANTEAELDAAERMRWMGDAQGWANRALRALSDADDPYRDTPRPDAPLREAGARVLAAVDIDSTAGVARALAEYVARFRGPTPS